MEVAVLLVILNLVLTGVLLLRFFVSSRSNGSPISADAIAREVIEVLRGDLQTHRAEIRDAITEGSLLTERRLIIFTEQQEKQAKANREEFTEARKEQQTTLTESLTTLNSRFEKLIESNGEKQTELQSLLSTSLSQLNERFAQLIESNGEKQSQLQKLLSDELYKLRKENNDRLEEMRKTVDEKLHETLEKRLSESFTLVSERLENVQKGLGEMQSLASDVGGLKRVLTNVKSRGTWVEVQLSRQLEDILTADQYQQNVPVRPGSRDVVEYAVKLPGRRDDEHVYLPIDSKFPQEDYEKLVDAHEAGSAQDVENAAKNLEKAIRAQAKIISDKYIHPPQTTDFAIMYLPTEGLFAEVISRPGLTFDLQNSLRVMVTGPTTLMSLLNSLQMGFKTLAIEKSTSEVWKILEAAKREFGKFGGYVGQAREATVGCSEDRR